MQRKKQQGFTLIEILIVVAIIAILASVVLIGLGPTQRAGRDARRLSDLREVQTGLELYYNKCGYYPGNPVASGACTGFVSGNTWADMTKALTETPDIGVNTVPNDPTAGHTYYYGTDVAGDGTGYLIAATLEDPNNGAFTNYSAPTMSAYTMGDELAPANCGVTGGVGVYCLTL